MGLLARYRAAGADLPFGHPDEPHRCAVEGWYWRAVLPDDGRVVAVMVGIADAGGSPWANLVLALHPEDEDIESIIVDGVGADRHAVRVGEAGRTTAGTVDVAVAGTRVRWRTHRIGDLRGSLWGALGPGHLIPGLGQHWTPRWLGLVEEGVLERAGERIDLAGARVYHERNWGAAFPRHGWWWGAAHAFDDPAVAVAFAGGTLRPGLPAPTALTLRTREGLLAAAPPRIVRADCGTGRWLVEARGPTVRVRLVGEADGVGLHLSHPAGPTPGDVERLARQHLDGRVEVVAERRSRGGWRTTFAGTSDYAGLEAGDADDVS